METTGKPIQLPNLPLLQDQQNDQPVEKAIDLQVGFQAEGVGAASHSTQPATQRNRRSSSRWTAAIKTWGLSQILIAMLCACGGIGAIALLWLLSLPPQTDCRNISPLSPDIQRLHCVQQAAQSGDLSQLLEGLRWVSSWPPEHPLYEQGQRQLNRWSKALLQFARQKFEQSDLQGAIDLANQIPQTSTAFPEAQELVAEWQGIWQAGEAIYAAAEVALKTQKWYLVEDKILELGSFSNDYWRQQKVDELTQRLLLEKEARQILQEAQQAARGQQFSDLGAAIAIARRVNPKTYAWSDAQGVLNQWIQFLINAGLQEWHKGNLAGAAAPAQFVPPDLVSDPVAQDLIQFSQAHQLATQPPVGLPSIRTIWNLLDAIAAIQQIQPSSSLYVQAQASAQDWQAQVEDLQQIELSKAIASLSHHSALGLAGTQVSLVEPESPYRVLAQTYLADWKQRRQRLEDRPLLVKARQQSEPGTIAALQGAIQVASRIAPNRALSQETQQWVERWQDQIETIEDQPILDEARAWAWDGHLEQAIRVADQIASDRALYSQAQEDIAEWQDQIYRILTAEDRPILDEAYALAAHEKYTLAIELVAQISPDRPIYDEAQAAIANWQVARAELLQRWAAEAEAAQSEPSLVPFNDSSLEPYPNEPELRELELR
jgi:hypothetical protein